MKSSQGSFHSNKLNRGSERGGTKSAGGSWRRPQCGCGGCGRSSPWGGAGWACPYLTPHGDTALTFLFSPSFPLCCRVQQELPARTNGSAPTAPALARDALHTKMEQLEEQLLSKILTLQKERQATSTDRSQQQHDIEKELNSLQNRVKELEHGESCPTGMEGVGGESWDKPPSSQQWVLTLLCPPHPRHAGPPGYSPPDAFKVTIPVQNNYMYARMKKSLPELYAFTICMWLKSKALAGLGTPFSYSVPSQANEIVLLEWGTNPLELLINDKVSPAAVGMGGRPCCHLLCFTPPGK